MHSNCTGAGLIDFLVPRAHFEPDETKSSRNYEKYPVVLPCSVMNLHARHIHTASQDFKPNRNAMLGLRKRTTLGTSALCLIIQIANLGFALVEEELLLYIRISYKIDLMDWIT